MSSRSAVAFALCLGAFLLPGDAHAECPSGSGAGGTGYYDVEGTGSGGTGIRGGDTGTGGTGLGGDTGTGGTGLHDAATSGTGGTGLIGTITGFGSVCVNGLRVVYGDEVAVAVDGRASDVASLGIGQVVRVGAVRKGGELRATHISAEAAVAGPVESFDAATGRLVIMGQSIDVGAATRRLASLEAGQRVSVSGLRRNDGVVSASRIDVRSSQDPDLVTGHARNATPRATYVGDTRADLGTAHADVVGVGERVQLVGAWNAERRLLVVEGARRAPIVESGQDRLSLEGYMAREGGELRVQGLPIDLLSGDSAASSEAAARVVGSRVLVEGEVRGGRLRVERLQREWRGSPQDRGGALDRADRSGRSGRSDRSDRGGRSGRSERPERGERPERSERPDRPERTERPDRSGRQ